jgi:hypothetical protein
MRLRATLISFSLVLFAVSLAQATGYVWAGPGDMPDEQKLLLFQQSEHRGQFINNALDETDDSTGYDVTHQNLEIKFDPTNHSIVGKVDMQFTVIAGPLSFIYLNLRNNLIVDSVRVNGLPVTFTFMALNDLRLNLTQPLAQGANATSIIYYHGFPVSGSWPNAPGLNWNTHLGTHIIWSLSEPDGARMWWPCKDVPWDKFTARMVWTVPSNLLATSNGTLQSVTVPQTGWKAYEWVENHLINTYLISVAATNYAKIRNWYVPTPADSMPLDHYVYPEDSVDAVSDFADIGDVIGFFASMFGEYSFLDEKYGHSAFPWSGGMEHQTNTSVGASLITGTGSYHWLFVHELAHEWWGDMLTCETWSDIWLNEGSATYCDALWMQHAQGQTAFNNRMSSFRSSYISSEPSEGRFPIAYPTNPNQMWGGTVYQKGAWIEHMLRYVVGEPNFLNFWPTYRDAYCPGNVPGTATTAEFETIWEQVSGQNLDWFFNEWVYVGTHYPEYQWGYQLVPQTGSTRVNLYIHQNQTLVSGTPIFAMPIQIKVNRTGLPQDSVVIWNSQQNQYHSFVVNGTVTGAPLFDPNVWILKSTSTLTYPTATVTVLMSPVSSPIVIPASGGSFSYNVTVTNNTSGTQSTQGWVMQRQPNGVWQGPMLGPVSLAIPGNTSISRLRNQNVPSTAAPGNYLYEGRVGTYPNVIVATSSFNYTKTTVGGGTIVREWANSGESFDPWLDPQSVIAPLEFALQGAFPNPFNPTTTIRFALPEASRVALTVYDINGRQVWAMNPTSANLGSGSHEITFDGSSLASGVYLYSLSAGSHHATGKMVLLK